ncbi:hypothetical protein [Microseira sp. BLCC-F43]|jgi:hypothetical protein|uniref:hypothetical protein n=1 Tax=Microseira sp. BLCC-F43 TaxID=3153602 RepID=UPI0035BA7D6F
MSRLVANILIAIGIIILIRAVVDFQTNGGVNTANQTPSPVSPTTTATPTPEPLDKDTAANPPVTPSRTSRPAADRSVPALW